MARAKKFKLFMGCLGNGVTVCNSAVEEHGDYKKVCHISPEGKITWYVKEDYPPEEARAKILEVAEAEKAKYDAWFNSLPEWKRYEITLDKMSLSELIEHLNNRDK